MFYQKKLLFLILVLAIYFTGFIFVSFFNSGSGALIVDIFEIPGLEKISGLSYRLKDPSRDSIPAVVLAHGISGSKQMMSSMALELARNGFVALTVDLIGHGGSEGVFGGFGFEHADRTLGIKDAVEYLKQQSFVDSSNLGLIGHSLGAGAIRAAALFCSDIQASVFIGGGLGENVPNSEFGSLNSTFPKNLLIIIGEHDVLFDLKFTKQQLIPVFGNSSEIIPNQTYGDFSDGTARRLIIPPTTHLLEPLDQSSVIEAVNWMKKSLDIENNNKGLDLFYLNREISIGVSLTAFSFLILPFSSIIFDIYPNFKQKQKEPNTNLKDWQVMVIWSFLSLALFLPMFFVGSLIPFPPLIFGNSFAWWLIITAIAGLMLVKFILPRYNLIQLNLKHVLSRSFTLKPALAAVGFFTLMYFTAYFSETIFLSELRIAVIPLFKIIPTTKRLLGFFTFIPFYLLYFVAEGFYLHKFRKPTSSSQINGLTKTILIKTIPYIILLSINYLSMFLLNIRVFPSFVGFIMEFILGMFPVFVISTIYSWWFYEKTGNLSIAAILNALLFSWLSAALFPVII